MLNSGSKFGLWTIETPTDRKRVGSATRQFYLCVCECGNKREVSQSNLVTGISTNCGCVRKAKLSALSTVHGFSKKEKLYGVWNMMRQRCTNPRNAKFPSYGGRGIRVCSDWSDYSVFRSWALSSGYSEGLAIDRINNDGPYSPSNCRWVTPQENSQNIRGHGASGVRGVSWHKGKQKWTARATVNYKIHHIGDFDSVEAANEAVKAFRRERLPMSSL